MFLATKGPAQPDAIFVIPDLHENRSRIRIEPVSRERMTAELRCDGRALVLRVGAANQRLAPGRPGRLSLPPRGQGAVTLDWRRETGTCRIDWGDSHSVILRPESEALPALSELSRAPLNCRVEPNLRLDPLQKVFLDEGAMPQTCPVAPGRVRLLNDPLDALIARIAALTGSTVTRDALTAGNPDLPLDFSNAPALDLIQISYLHIRADCPSSYKMGQQSGLSIGGSGSFV